MADEILETLQRLEAGQKELRGHLDSRIDELAAHKLKAVSESNQSVLNAISRLHADIQDQRERVRELELKAS